MGTMHQDDLLLRGIQSRLETAPLLDRLAVFDEVIGNREMLQSLSVRALRGILDLMEVHHSDLEAAMRINKQ